MADMVFRCPGCGEFIAVAEASGDRLNCPWCSAQIAPPSPEVDFGCSGCGARLCGPKALCGQEYACPSCGSPQSVPRDAPARKPKLRVRKSSLSPEPGTGKDMKRRPRQPAAEAPPSVFDLARAEAPPDHIAGFPPGSIREDIMQAILGAVSPCEDIIGIRDFAVDGVGTRTIVLTDRSLRLIGFRATLFGNVRPEIVQDGCVPLAEVSGISTAEMRAGLLGPKMLRVAYWWGGACQGMKTALDDHAQDFVAALRLFVT